jgi:hypothetical protein
VEKLKSPLVFLIYALLLFALFVWLALGYSGAYGAFDLDDPAALVEELQIFGIAAGFTTLGIVSKMLFDILWPDASAKGASLNWKHGLAAMLVAPIVVFGVFETLIKIESTIIAVLFCYQNGFFFQTILEKKKE